MKFYIPSQMLKCDFCSTEMDPYAFHKETDAEESDFFDVTVFTCPQCGGELYSTENDATAFCSFCGASNILTSRVSKEKRPAYILPFRKTKEDCKKAYSKMMKGAFYAPKELKDAAHIDGFRGIYMPYWFYNISQKGPANMKGKKTYRRGDYVITDHYNLSCNVDGEYNNLPFDSSSSFDDNLSAAIAPFDVRKAQEFTPAFLSGFYADTADVEEEVYRTDALDIATDKTYEEIKKTSAFRDISITTEESSMARAYAVNSCCSSIDRAMLPVWFLSYRKGDRVAYATVNGQTGKVAADLPVDPKKYLLGSLLTALPIYVLLNLFFTMIPSTILIFAMALAMCTLILYGVELSQIVRKETGADDKGLMSKKKEPDTKKTKKQNTSPWWKNTTSLIVAVLLFFTIGTQLAVALIAFVGKYLWIGLLAGGIIAGSVSSSCLKKLTINKKRYGFIGGILSLVLAAVILLVNPVADYFYYGGVVAAVLAVFFSIYDLIYYYNILATRKLPQFERTGGDDRA